jgi:hypothetical protein
MRTPRRRYRKSDIARHWYLLEQDAKSLPWLSFDNWFEPQCFACHSESGSSYCEYWDSNRECTHSDPLRHWDLSRLEKCHVVPVYLGGPDELQNIVLMCGWCHREQPDDPDPEVTYQWMRWRPEVLSHRIMSAVQIAIEHGGSAEQIKERARLILGQNNKEAAERTREGMAERKRQGVHCGRARVLPVSVVRNIVRQHESGASLAAIAADLNAASVPTAHQGKRWYPSTVRGVLTSNYSKDLS